MRTTELNELAYLVARLYYLENLTQQKIADTLGISRSKVSRLLLYARENGIVEIRLNPIKTNMSKALAEYIKKFLNLKEVIVVENVEKDEKIIARKIAKAGAEYISKILKDGQTVGWGWGRTIYLTVQFLNSNKKLSSNIFLPLIGGAGQTNRYYQSNSLVEKAADAFKARALYLNAPALFEDERTLSMFLKERAIENILNMWRRLSVAIFGLGKPVYESELIKAEIDSSIVLELIRERAVGDILARFFDKEGNLCRTKLNDLILGIDLNTLKEVPLRICLCGGEKKVEGIIAASKKGYFNVLVTDSTTASAILNRVRGEGDEGSFLYGTEQNGTKGHRKT